VPRADQQGIFVVPASPLRDVELPGVQRRLVPAAHFEADRKEQRLHVLDLPLTTQNS